MKYPAALLFLSLALHAQLIPDPITPPATLSQPAIGRQGLTGLAASNISPDGQLHLASDLYILGSGNPARKLTSLAQYGAVFVDLSTDGSKAAYNVAPTLGMEELHLVDTASGADQTIAVDTAGCIRPLAICLGCVFTCIRSVHFTPDASKVVYSASETQPVYVVNADGSGAVHLPIQGAVLAPSPQRVVSRSGTIVFTMMQDVYVANLDGSGLQNLTNFPAGQYASNAAISEDGATIAFQMQPAPVNGQATNQQIYILHLDGNPPRPLTTGTVDSTNPSISADGSLVAFVSANQALIQPTDGSRPATALTRFTFLNVNGVTLSGDGSTAMVSAGNAIYAAATGMTARRIFAPQTIFADTITILSGFSPPAVGSLFHISGWNFEDDALFSAPGFPLPPSLGGVTVRVNGQAIPLLSITPTQITAQMPFTTAMGTANLEVDFDGGPAVTAATAVQSTAPEVLEYVTPFFSSIWAMAFHAGTNIPADQAHPAVAGETLEMFGTGLGAVTPAVDAGMPGPSNPPAVALATPMVKIGNRTAQVTFAGLAPGLAGIDQVNVVVPSGLASGRQPVSWSPGGSALYAIWVQ